MTVWSMTVCRHVCVMHDCVCVQARAAACSSLAVRSLNDCPFFEGMLKVETHGEQRVRQLLYRQVCLSTSVSCMIHVCQEASVCQKVSVCQEVACLIYHLCLMCVACIQSWSRASVTRLSSIRCCAAYHLSTSVTRVSSIRASVTRLSTICPESLSIICLSSVYHLCVMCVSCVCHTSAS